MNAEQTLLTLIELFTHYLDELTASHAHTEFICGEKTAYVECLEIIKGWDNSAKFGLDFRVADKYNV